MTRCRSPNQAPASVEPLARKWIGLASVPVIVKNGADWFSSMGTEKSKGMTLYSLSGHVKRPGQYEAPLGITLRQLLDLAGGVREGHELKFWTPGGSSTPLLTAEHLDVPLDFEAVGEAGSMLGTRALQVFDETTLAYVQGRPFTPKGVELEQAMAYWRTLRSDADAPWDAVVELDASTIRPQVTWGTNPGMVVPITGIPLPFLSYGGSFLLVNLMAVAIVQRVAAEAGG